MRGSQFPGDLQTMSILYQAGDDDLACPSFFRRDDSRQTLLTRPLDHNPAINTSAAVHSYPGDAVRNRGELRQQLCRDIIRYFIDDRVRVQVQVLSEATPQ